MELVAEIPKVEKLTVQDRLELARKRRSQQLKRWEREKDEELGPPPPKKKPMRAKPVKFEPRIILLEAASRGDVKEVKTMLDYGVDPNLANDDGLTALHQACIDECDDIAELLVDYGANIDAEDRELWTPLHASAACGNASMVEYLVDHGANVVAINADGNLAVDLVEDDEDLKNYLFKEMDKHGFDESKVDELVILREKQMLEDIKDAIEKKRDLEIQDMEGATALHIAAANAYEEVLEFLLENDADVDVEDKDGWKPIHAAACWGNEKAIELLVEHGAELDSRTPYGETPLDLCEDADTRQFIIDLKSKIKTNKFKVRNNRRKRNNSRSLSVKRSSLKEKISISQNEAKAEAILRQHPELAFLITKDKKTTNEEAKPMDVSVEENNVKPKESPSLARRNVEEKRPLPSNNTKITETSTTKTHERTFEVKSKTVVVGVKGVASESREKVNKSVADTTNNIVKDTKSSETETRGRDVAARKEESATTNVQFQSRNVAKKLVVQEKTTSKTSETFHPPTCPPPRSPSSGRRQLPADPPSRFPQTTKESITIKSSHTAQGVVERNEQRTPAAKPLSELSVNSNTPQQSVTETSKSSKARVAPPVPMPRSSGSTSVPVPRSSGGTSAPVPVPRSSGSASGRSQVPQSDTSGYPDSFNKRKSRDSREISDAALNQLAKDIKSSKVVSPQDVKLSSQAVTVTKYTPKPTTPTVPQRNVTPATIDVTSETTHPKQTSDVNNKSNDINSSFDEPKKKFKQPNDVTVEQHKNSCCVLM